MKSKTIITNGILFFVIIQMLWLTTLNSCNIFRKSIDKSLLAGYWLTTEPDIKPNIILDSIQDFFLLLENSETGKKFHHTYKLKGDVMTIWVNQRLWASKNKIAMLTNDSLVYIRRGDKEVFRYGRKRNR